MLIWLFSIGVGLALSVCCTPLVRRLAIQCDIFAPLNSRTIHDNLTPKMGGVAIYIGFSGALLVYASLNSMKEFFPALLFGGAVSTLVGALDDIYDINCYLKLLGQSIAAIIAVQFGFTLDVIALPFEVTVQLGNWSSLFSVFWIVLIMNAVNLIDGLDGLAAGFSIITSFFVLIVSLMFGNTTIAFIASALAFASLGFLKDNFFPAKIFMGDTGSLFIGFVLACITMKSLSFSGQGTNWLVVLTVFALPLTDTLLAITRRLSERKHPFSADKKHIHHLLLANGLSHRSAVLVIYSIALLLCLAGLAFLFLQAQYGILVMSFVFFLFLSFLVLVGCLDFVAKKSKLKKLQPVSIQKSSK